MGNDMTNEIQNLGFQITSLDQAMTFAKMIAESDLAPKDYRGKSGNVLIAMQFGAEIGLKPLQSIQNISIINGRPAVWGDAMIALVQGHVLCEYIHERYENDTAYCTIKRRGDKEEYTYEFSKEDAKKAGLINKPGTWSQYPERMQQMRARAFALRDKFSDILKGIAIREEVQDYVVEVNNENNKKQSVKILDNLIKEKNNSPVIFEDVCQMINDASTMEELDYSVEFAKDLAEENKKEARELYKLKYNELMKKITGEIMNDSKVK